MIGHADLPKLAVAVAVERDVVAKPAADTARTTMTTAAPEVAAIAV